MIVNATKNKMAEENFEPLDPEDRLYLELMLINGVCILINNINSR